MAEKYSEIMITRSIMSAVLFWTMILVSRKISTSSMKPFMKNDAKATLIRASFMLCKRRQDAVETINNNAARPVITIFRNKEI